MACRSAICYQAHMRTYPLIGSRYTPLTPLPFLLLLARCIASCYLCAAIGVPLLSVRLTPARFNWQAQARRMLIQVDLDHDGKIDLEEFLLYARANADVRPSSTDSQLKLCCGRCLADCPQLRCSREALVLKESSSQCRSRGRRIQATLVLGGFMHRCVSEHVAHS